MFRKRISLKFAFHRYFEATLFFIPLQVYSLLLFCCIKYIVAGNPPYADIHPLKAMQLVVKSPPPQVPVKHSAQYKQLIEAMLQKDPTQVIRVLHLL